ncbi:hypothetical protein [Salisediminibacterium beveridgei]|uniref:Uncharacterized protein n=1 Tax=Salisediminibacterium beveridgei TaxID=632773 RepID=A0A1D7QZY5_9BACI|nr:hypothetical protein [Salisediminibacterium beveridgei]AOM84562.1 hypothetical protein BBEV_3247 [Salisediminibacterium beveridgei]
MIIQKPDRLTCPAFLSFIGQLKFAKGMKYQSNVGFAIDVVMTQAFFTRNERLIESPIQPVGALNG